MGDVPCAARPEGGHTLFPLNRWLGQQPVQQPPESADLVLGTVPCFLLKLATLQLQLWDTGRGIKDVTMQCHGQSRGCPQAYLSAMHCPFL